MTIRDQTDEVRAFVDALRVCLGLAPLYNQKPQREIDRFMRDEQTPPWDPLDAHYVSGLTMGVGHIQESDFMHRDRFPKPGRQKNVYYRKAFMKSGRTWKVQQ
jgi:hypothetical protein